ncbi:MAG TPA: histidine phosphatase family protein [Rhizomicrobium sp.]|jgi:probable phosphoglycerate mutase|nr:histidine phosphatase family protein [Rhizomicrobium sp.]
MSKKRPAAKERLELAEGVTLYFSRHGETEANIQKRFQGHTVNTPLTKRGLKQAKTLAKILKAHADDPAALKYVCSPLHRTRETMEIVRTHLHLPPKGYKTDKRIEEIDLGVWDGLTHEEARALDPKAFDRREKDKWNVRVPGGEDYADVADRAERWVKSIKHDTFAISHGAFTRILRGLFLGLSAEEMSALDEPQGVVFRVRGHKVKRYDNA